MTVGSIKKRSFPKENVCEESEFPIPPDGGWGWVVVFASFMIHLIADGVTYTFGIFFVALNSYYKESKGATAWIASILVGVTLGSGPIASALTNKYGCRAVTIAGAILASIGLFISIFAPNIVTLYFTIGLCSGIGFGLIYLPAIVSVTCYFEKRRSFATGIAVCGSGLGTFVFAPVVEALVEHYNWKGAMMVVAGIVLNCIVFGALFRPLKSPAKKKIPKVVKMRVVSNGVSNHYSTEEKEKLFNFPNNLDLVINTPGSRHSFHPTMTESETVDSTLSNLSSTPQQYTNGYLAPPPTIDPKAVRKSNSACNLETHLKTNLQTRTLLASYKRGESENAPGPMYRKDVFYSGSLVNLPAYRSNPSMFTASVTHIPRAEPDSDPDTGCLSKETKDALNEMMDLTLMYDPIFVLFAISNFCTSIGFNAPYVYLKDRALMMGLGSEESSYLLGVIGVSNTLSRVVLGYVSDKPGLNRLWLYNWALTLCGLGTFFSFLCYDFWTLALYAALFGATAGAYVGLTSVILVDLLGLERLTNAFGLLLLFQGVAATCGPPLIGEMYDILKSYDPGFCLAGFMIAVSGLILFFIPCLQRWDERRKEKKLATSEKPPTFNSKEQEATKTLVLDNSERSV